MKERTLPPAAAPGATAAAPEPRGRKGEDRDPDAFFAAALASALVVAAPPRPQAVGSVDGRSGPAAASLASATGSSEPPAPERAAAPALSAKLPRAIGVDPLPPADHSRAIDLLPPSPADLSRVTGLLPAPAAEATTPPPLPAPRTAAAAVDPLAEGAHPPSRGVEPGLALDTGGARLSVRDTPAGALSLDLRMRDGSLDIRAGGAAAPVMAANEAELRVALAGAGMRLGQLVVDPPQDRGRMPGDDEDGPHETDDEADDPPATRRIRA